MPRGQFNVCAIHTRTHLARYAYRDTRREEYTFLGNPRHRYRRTEFYYERGRYRLPRLHRLQNAPMRIARIGADTPSAKTNCMYARARRHVHAYACYARLYIDFCQGYNVHVHLSRSVIDDRFAVKRRNLDVEIIGSAAFSICSKLSRSRDGRHGRKMHLHSYRIPSSGLHDRHRALALVR